MSRDIRSFFTAASRKPAPKITKPTAIEDSDEEMQVIQASPQQRKKARRTVVIDSDSDDAMPKAVKPKPKREAEKLKPVDDTKIFGNSAIKQSKVEKIATEKKEEKVSKSKKKKEVAVISFDEDDLLLENLDILDKTMEEAKLSDPEKNQTKAGSSKENSPNKKDSTPPKTKSNEKGITSEKKKTPKATKPVEADGTPTGKKRKWNDPASSGDPQNIWEMKKYCSMQYEKYKNRGGPRNHGLKEYPEGKPTCLQGVTLIRTGVLDSLEGAEFEELVKKHGGQISHSVTKKVNFVVVGEEPGPAKLAKASSYSIPTIDEDEFLDMILVRSDMPPKYKQQQQNTEEDSGLGTSQSTEELLEPIIKRMKIDPPKKSTESTDVKKSPIKTKTVPQNKEVFEKSAPKVNNSTAWTDKYKPSDLKSIIGQQHDSSEMNGLKRWLQSWKANKVSKKCALLSGPPGVGKTTTATLVSKELGFDIVEFNASDTRSKKSLQDLVRQLTNSRTIAGFASGDASTKRPRVLLMDEVDGMAGNEDRGGMQELIDVIKHTQIPIICMCNDRQHQKIRSLASYCLDLSFKNPKMEQVRGAMLSICYKENLTIPSSVLTEIIIGAGCDIRQTLNNMYMWGMGDKQMTLDVAKQKAKDSKKDKVPGPWDVLRMVFNATDHANMSFLDKSRLFFHDYSLGPLFVQENYIRIVPKEATPKQRLVRMAAAADAISFGALIEQKIRSTNNWSLLEVQAMYSSVMPGAYMSGSPRDAPRFPAWLGKNSKRGKLDRMVTEIQTHTKKVAGASKMAVRMDLVKPLRTVIWNNLSRGTDEDIENTIEFMGYYQLTRDDMDSLGEVMTWPRKKLPEIPTKVKSKFTRQFNKANAKVSHVLKPKAKKRDMDDDEADGIVDEDTEEEDDISKNPMIKKVKLKTESDKSKKAEPINKAKGKAKAKKK